MKNTNIYLAILFCTLLFAACKKNKEYEANEIHTIPQGEEGVLEDGDYSGEGTATNTAGTTVIIDGTVTLDGLSASGKISVPEGATLIVNSTTNIGGGALIDVKGTLITQSFTMVGNTYLSNGQIKVNGKFTIGGGTTLFMENGLVQADELVIIGHIQGVDNSTTQAGNWYSMIALTGSKYLNRGGGTTVCGPVLFNVNTDQGASGAEIRDVTTDAISKNKDIKTVYNLDPATVLYQYESTCIPLVEMPSH